MLFSAFSAAGFQSTALSLSALKGKKRGTRKDGLATSPWGVGIDGGGRGRLGVSRLPPLEVEETF